MVPYYLELENQHNLVHGCFLEFAQTLSVSWLMTCLLGVSTYILDNQLQLADGLIMVE